jgi:hypothetical protein
MSVGWGKLYKGQVATGASYPALAVVGTLRKMKCALLSFALLAAPVLGWIFVEQMYNTSSCSGTPFNSMALYGESQSDLTHFEHQKSAIRPVQKKGAMQMQTLAQSCTTV